MIKLEKTKQPPYEPTYSLDLVELETFKTFIETYLANSFIYALKLAIGALILFIFKPNGSVYLFVNYLGLKKPHNQKLISFDINW